MPSNPFDVSDEGPCPFCAYLAGSIPCAFILRGPLVSVFLNRAQFERGASLVIPNRHVTSLPELERELDLRGAEVREQRTPPRFRVR
jgi:diadenosine tetraphosphate (Ap4A) HIT family hydrolase